MAIVLSRGSLGNESGASFIRDNSNVVDWEEMMVTDERIRLVDSMGEIKMNLHGNSLTCTYVVISENQTGQTGAFVYF